MKKLFKTECHYLFLKHFVDIFCVGKVSVSVHSLTAFLYAASFLNFWFFGEPSWVEIGITYMFRFTCLAQGKPVHA